MVFLNRRTADRLTIGGGGGCGGSSRQVDLRRRIDPAGVHAGGEAFGRLRVRISHPDNATKRSLNVARRAAKPVVQLHMPEGGVEIIAVKEPDRAPPEPDALRLAGRAVQQLGRFCNLIHLLGVFRLARRLTLIAGFWFLSSGERSQKKESRYARGARDQTHPDGSHGCSNLLGLNGPINPLMRLCLAGIAALAALSGAAGLVLQRSTLIQLKQQHASPPIWCAKNSLGHSTGRTRLSLLGAGPFESMLADIGRYI